MKHKSVRIPLLLGCKYPIIQAGMVYCSGWELASAVSNAGGFGIIGSGGMYPDELKEELARCKAATDKPFGVNVPLIYPDVDAHMASILEAGVPVVFTSAGNPKTWTDTLKAEGRKVVHVVSSEKFARKAEAAGVDAIVAEGFEAGGHNGREETTTLCLVPAVADAVSVPVIAAGGISDGRTMAAALILGAEAVQIGSRFVATPESCAHQAFKEKVVEAGEGATTLTLKELTPVRMLHNPFFQQVREAYSRGASPEELKELLGRGRAKRGMKGGDVEDGELEIGQVAGRIRAITPAADIVTEIWNECQSLLS